MKITNWRKKLAAALVAAGIWVPSTAFATDIPLGDPSFEDFTVSAYAYSDTYRPTSAWVDDLYSTGGYVEDDGNTHNLAELILAAFESSLSGTTWTIKKTDGSTTYSTRTITTDADADPITAVT